jgi:hypothetical protein
MPRKRKYGGADPDELIQLFEEWMPADDETIEVQGWALRELLERAKRAPRPRRGARALSVIRYGSNQLHVLKARALKDDLLKKDKQKLQALADKIARNENASSTQAMALARKRHPSLTALQAEWLAVEEISKGAHSPSQSYLKEHLTRTGKRSHSGEKSPNKNR